MKFNQETRTTISASTGMVKLASGTITTPVAFIDLSLPLLGYVKFLFVPTGLLFSARPSLSLAFSYDGGNSFLSGSFDAYLEINQTLAGPVWTPTAQDGAINCLIAPVDGAQAIEATLWVAPGDQSNFTQVYGEQTTGSTGSGVFPFFGTLNPDAAIPPTAARATTMRVQPYGNGDANPPTSGETLTGGSYVLWGISA